MTVIQARTRYDHVPRPQQRHGTIPFTRYLDAGFSDGEGSGAGGEAVRIGTCGTTIDVRAPQLLGRKEDRAGRSQEALNCRRGVLSRCKLSRELSCRCLLGLNRNRGDTSNWFQHGDIHSVFVFCLTKELVESWAIATEPVAEKKMP